ncbi:MAG: carbamoyl phosphate synthase large subunit, partial [Rhodospirillaceae bacterium]|nr:carbamoyl phosphate synthase large subunit [Rhodospirillaceae bacterium]
KPMAGKLAKRLVHMGFKLLATGGTTGFLRDQGLDVIHVNKVLEGRPHCEDAILSGEVQLVINTTEGAQAIADSYSIRRSALTSNVPHYTTMTGASAAIGAISALIEGDLHGGLEVAPLQSYFSTSF